MRCYFISKLLAITIEWDIDNEDNTELPETIEISEGMIEEDQISDYLSEQTGCCHKGFTLVIM